MLYSTLFNSTLEHVGFPPWKTARWPWVCRALPLPCCAPVSGRTSVRSLPGVLGRGGLEESGRPSSRTLSRESRPRLDTTVRPTWHLGRALGSRSGDGGDAPLARFQRGRRYEGLLVSPVQTASAFSLRSILQVTRFPWFSKGSAERVLSLCFQIKILCES